MNATFTFVNEITPISLNNEYFGECQSECALRGGLSKAHLLKEKKNLFASCGNLINSSIPYGIWSNKWWFEHKLLSIFFCITKGYPLMLAWFASLKWSIWWVYQAEKGRESVLNVGNSIFSASAPNSVIISSNSDDSKMSSDEFHPMATNFFTLNLLQTLFIWYWKRNIWWFR